MRDDTKINYRHNREKTYHPETKRELYFLIENIYEEKGPGTKNEPIDLNMIDTSKIHDMSNIFSKSEFEYIDVSDWDVSNVKKMMSMFDTCKSLKSIGDITNWNVQNVDNFRRMFYKCKQLGNVGHLNAWKVNPDAIRDDMFKWVGDDFAIPLNWK